MGYNLENYKRIRDEYEGKAKRARDAANQRADELHRKFDAVDKIDRILSETGLKIFGESMKGKDGLDERIERLKKENYELREIRSRILIENGYPADYSSVKYECEVCMDTGFIGTKMCDCMRRELILAGYESSGIGKLIRTQSFESFDLSYYNNSPEQADNMKNILNIAKGYAANFDPSQMRNLIFMGSTGLGKTHLTTSIAKVIIERGYDVVYDSFQNIIRLIDSERFNYDQPETLKSAKYYECELLIIDDLGAENTNQYTISSLYNLLNTRLNNCKSMIINTNLLVGDLQERYKDRIASRLFGQFESYYFYGSDIRVRNNRSLYQ